MMKKLLTFGALCALAGCATTPTDILGGVEASDSAALAALIVYQTTPAAKTPAGVALIQKLGSAQAIVDQELLPLETAEETCAAAATDCSAVVTAAKVEAVQTAIDGLVALENSNGIK